LSLRVYLDDCANSDLLADLLSQAGHAVIRPSDANVSMEGAVDDMHFAFAKANNLTIITKNPSDFKNLHLADANHAGILAVYQDNDPNRDMSDAEIVRSIANLELAAQTGGEPIQGRFHSLNDWRY
jgi:predicted nuclease of predicted toxin-antitoxin system